MEYSRDNPPKLAPPGAGLPFYQQLVSRYLILPAFFARNSWDSAIKIYRAESDLILSTGRKLSSADASEPVLVSGIWGIEDSSRFWSLAMVMEHLTMFADWLGPALIALADGKGTPAKTTIEAIKPRGDKSQARAIKDFSESSKHFVRQVGQELQSRGSEARLDHPWFGALTARQWLCLAALHQRIHRLQAQAIVRGIEKRKPL